MGEFAFLFRRRMKNSSDLISAVTLWYKPGQTMQGLIQNGRGHGGAIILSALFGLVQAGRVSVAQVKANSDGLYTGVGLGPFLVGAFSGICGLYLFAWLLRNFSRWFGGDASVRQVRVGLGWGLLPWTVLFFALTFVVLGAADPNALAEAYGIFFVGFLYGYVILLLSLSTALGLSTWKTFFCLAVTVLVSVFPLTLLLQVLDSVL